MKAGANDYVIKGSEDFESNLKLRISQALEKLRLERKNRELEVANISHIEKNRKLAEKVAADSRNYKILGSSTSVAGVLPSPQYFHHLRQRIQRIVSAS